MLTEYPVAIPPSELLARFNRFVGDTVAQIHNLTLRNRNLRRTRDLLLPRLVSGELDVSGLAIEDAAA